MVLGTETRTLLGKHSTTELHFQPERFCVLVCKDGNPCLRKTSDYEDMGKQKTDPQRGFLYIPDFSGSLEM